MRAAPAWCAAPARRAASPARAVSLKRAASPGRAFSLLELLVAMLVVAVGVLGITGLQLASAANNRAALEHSLAAVAATDLVERMAANPGPEYSAALGSPPPAFVDCLSADCAPSQLADFDLAVWKCAFGVWRNHPTCRGLPPALRSSTALAGGDGAVEEQSGQAVVAVLWGGGTVFEVAAPR